MNANCIVTFRLESCQLPGEHLLRSVHSSFATVEVVANGRRAVSTRVIKDNLFVPMFDVLFDDAKEEIRRALVGDKPTKP